MKLSGRPSVSTGMSIRASASASSTGAAGAAEDRSFFHRDDCIMAARQVSHQGDIERLGEAHVGDGRVDPLRRRERGIEQGAEGEDRDGLPCGTLRESSRRISPVPNGISVISAWTATPAAGAARIAHRRTDGSAGTRCRAPAGTRSRRPGVSTLTFGMQRR
jgi:hypothetical protein